MPENDDVDMVPIEYFLINIPSTLNEDPKLLIETLTNQDNIEAYDNMAI